MKVHVPAAVRRAERELQSAQQEQQGLRERVIDGDEGVSAEDLARAAGAVELASLRLEAAQREAERPTRTAEDARRRKALSAYERRAAERAAEHRRTMLTTLRNALLVSDNRAHHVAETRAQLAKRTSNLDLNDPEVREILEEAGVLADSMTSSGFSDGLPETASSRPQSKGLTSA